ncbi:unnamed protein product [Adineta steineri]|uniref:Uncharacterized protein n=1 Tax=Adineta steineri TaxID=433720 RepID=A0A815VEX2_9BILA|nr:unnamed protein product [Adineta steineri]
MSHHVYDGRNSSSSLHYGCIMSPRLSSSSCHLPQGHHQMQGLHHQADQASSGHQIIIISTRPITTGAPPYHQDLAIIK